MKRTFLLTTAACLSLAVFAQKAPKKAFSTEYPPLSGCEWLAGEPVNLYGSQPQGVIYTTTDAGQKTAFMGNGARRTEEGHWVAIYPASALRMWGENTLYFTIPREQVAQKGGFPVYNRTEGRDFEFKPLTAFIKFEIPAGFPDVKEIRISTDKFISGNFKANLGAKNVSVQLDTGIRFREIVLKPENDGVMGAGEYRVALFARPLPNGLTMEIVAADGTVATRKITAELKFALGKTRDLGILHNVRFFDRSAPSRVGTALGKEGVIFWEDPENPLKGKAVAATEAVSQWATTNQAYGIHNEKENYLLVHETVTALPAYKANPGNFPAVKACDEMRKALGGNWHVPSLAEMKYLFNAYYGQAPGPLPENGTEYSDDASREAAARFNAALTSLGGTPLLASSDEYWICGQNSNGNLQYVNLRKFQNSHAVQTTERTVRCVLDFEEAQIVAKDGYPKTDVGKRLESAACQRVVKVLWDTTYTVTPGLEYYELKLVTDANEPQDVFLLRVDPSQGLDVRVAISSISNPPVWKRQTPVEMAKHVSTPERPVYAVVNADFCDNREPIRPRGPIHCEGKIWAPSYSIDPHFTQQALSYLGVTFDGKMTIGPSSNYPIVRKDLKECTGGGVILVKNSQIQGGYVTQIHRDPRTAVGFNADNIVWILAVDARHGTNGMTYGEEASIFQGLGCTDAVNLDGGGSTQMRVRDPETGELMLRNWPSDPHYGFGGRERPRLNAWMVVKH